MRRGDGCEGSSTGAGEALVVVGDHGEHLGELLNAVIELAPDHLTHEEVQIRPERQAQTSIAVRRL